MTGQALRPDHPRPRALDELIERFAPTVRAGDPTGIRLTGVTSSSLSVEAGDLYAGLPGAHVHGATFWAEAEAAGAAAILTDEAGTKLAAATTLPLLTLSEVRSRLGHIAAWLYGTAQNPARFYGVTGTNGKTSVIYLLCALLGQLGETTGLSSTAERRIGDRMMVSSLTTPEASELHGLLARMAEERVEAVGLEVSAQALTRHRVDGVRFDVVGFTNLSHDHLDDYASMAEYFDAKALLFGPDRARRAVIDVDTLWGRRLSTRATVPAVTLTSSDGGEADWHVHVTGQSVERTAFSLTGPDGIRLETSVPVVGRYMAANAGMALVMAVEAGHSIDDIRRVLDRDGGFLAYIPGRLERMPSSGPAVFIDYGHTPEAFRATLESLRAVTAGRIIMVFGADGDRDTTKRGDMGAIAARGADAVIITDFHPRYEDPAAIRASLLAGARSVADAGKLLEVADPKRALRTALAMARAGDTVLYAGPGHENYREVAGRRIPYSARDDARAALDEQGWLL